jgi:uncharacterized protein
MSSRFPERVDPWHLADQGRMLGGTCAFSEMARLAPLLVDAGGNASFRLVFERDQERRAVVRVAVDAVLRLTCQRCLEPLDHEVHSRCVLAVVGSVDEGRRLPESYESLLVVEGTVRPLEIVEEELLLAIPAVPRHARPCAPSGTKERPAGGNGGDASPNPFAVLAGLRGGTGEE